MRMINNGETAYLAVAVVLLLLLSPHAHSLRECIWPGCAVLRPCLGAGGAGSSRQAQRSSFPR